MPKLMIAHYALTLAGTTISFMSRTFTQKHRTDSHCFPSPVSGDQIYAWINRHLPDGPKPPLVRPINYMRIASGITVLMGAVTLFTVLSPYILPIVRNRNLWAAFSLIAILLFTSGHMFNHIRKVPYVVGDGRGGISYFAGGFSNQFGMETQIVAAICKPHLPLSIPVPFWPKSK